MAGGASSGAVTDETPGALRTGSRVFGHRGREGLVAGVQVRRLEDYGEGGVEWTAENRFDEVLRPVGLEPLDGPRGQVPSAHEHADRSGEEDRRQREGQPAMPINQIAERFKAHCGNGASARVRSSLTVDTALPTATSRQLPAVASKAAKG